MYKDKMKLKNVSVEAQFSSYYDDYMDAQIERLDAERPTLSFEAFLSMRLMARQFIIGMAV